MSILQAVADDRCKSLVNLDMSVGTNVMFLSIYALLQDVHVYKIWYVYMCIYVFSRHKYSFQITSFTQDLIPLTYPNVRARIQVIIACFV